VIATSRLLVTTLKITNARLRETAGDTEEKPRRLRMDVSFRSVNLYSLTHNLTTLYFSICVRRWSSTRTLSFCFPAGLLHCRELAKKRRHVTQEVSRKQEMVSCKGRILLPLLLLILFCFLASVCAVDRTKFRTCQDTGFCRRYRGKYGPTFGTNVS